MKGGARIVRAQALVASCERLEAQCTQRPADTSQVRQAARALEETMLRLDRWLASYLGSMLPAARAVLTTQSCLPIHYPDESSQPLALD